MTGLARSSKGRQRGQTLTLFVLSIFTMLGMAAMSIDVGMWYLTKQQLQDAGDHAALAGASALPSLDVAAARAVAQGHKNMPEGSFTASTPYAGDANKFAVDGRVAAPMFFAQLFGLGDITIRTHSVASAHPGSGSAAVFTHTRGPVRPLAM